MVKPCPGCGAITVPEARFCRTCGAPLKTASMSDSDAPISPLAQTVPLKGEGRATDGLNADDARRNHSDTSKVGQAEMEKLLRQTPRKRVSDGDGSKKTEASSESAAPQTTVLPPATVAATSLAPPAISPSPAQESQQASSVRSRRLWQGAAVALLCVALIAGVLAFVLSRRAGSSENSNTTPIAISDTKQLVGEKLAEAETLLAAGEFNRAEEVLRAALKLDPSNVEAHMRLGNALERTGARAEAIDEYRAAAQSDPNNVSAWRALAAAQFEEKLYKEAAESYRRLLESSGNSFDDETWLAYGDALRLAGRDDEARAAYQKITASASSAIAQEAQRHLAELKPPSVAINTEHTSGAPDAGQRQEPETTPPQPTPAPQPSATPTAANTKAYDPDTYYFMGLNMVNGRDPKKLTDGELAAALNYFLRAQGGTHSAEAKRNADRLGKEYDRRRKR